MLPSVGDAGPFCRSNLSPSGQQILACLQARQSAYGIGSRTERTPECKDSEYPHHPEPGCAPREVFFEIRKCYRMPLNRSWTASRGKNEEGSQQWRDRAASGRCDPRAVHVGDLTKSVFLPGNTSGRKRSCRRPRRRKKKGPGTSPLRAPTGAVVNYDFRSAEW